MTDATSHAPLKLAATLTAVAVLSLAGCQSHTHASRDTVAPAFVGSDASEQGKSYPGYGPSRDISFLQPGTGVNAEREFWPALLDGKVSPQVAIAQTRRTPAVDAFGRMRDEATPRSGFGDAAGGFRQHTFSSEGFDTDVTLSPDGRTFVYASTRHAPTTDIYLQRVDGQAVVQLTSDPAEDMFPSFSPDGSKIAFASNRSGNWDLYVMDADGRNVVQLTRTEQDELHPSWSPDGTRLAFCSTGARSGQWELWIIRADGTSPTMIGPGLFPVWSPDPDKDVIAFQRARQRGTRWYSLWTCTLEPDTPLPTLGGASATGEAKAFTEVAASTNAAIVAPAWSSDGKQLAFGTVVNAPQGTDGMQDIWLINADGSNRRRLTDGIGTYACPAWGPGGRVFFTSNRNGTEAIWSMHASETQSTPSYAGVSTEPQH